MLLTALAVLPQPLHQRKTELRMVPRNQPESSAAAQTSGGRVKVESGQEPSPPFVGTFDACIKYHVVRAIR